jgi:hypothetical protein
MRNLNYRLAAILMVAVASGRPLVAKDKHRKTNGVNPQDQIVVDSHLRVADGPITRFIATRHYDRTYVYAEREAGKPITLIDVTQLGHPRILSEVIYPGATSGNLLAVAGTAALAGDAPAVPTKTPPAQTIRLMDFSDPANPKVTRQFSGVTAIEKLSGLILLANAEGIWILSQQFAEDPEVERRYANKVIYGDSQY